MAEFKKRFKAGYMENATKNESGVIDMASLSRKQPFGFANLDLNTSSIIVDKASQQREDDSEIKKGIRELESDDPNAPKDEILRRQRTNKNINF